MHTPPPAPVASRPLVASFVLGGLAMFSALPALLSVMLFDAPGSEKNPFVVMTVIGMLAFPVLCVLAVVLAWIGYAARSPRFTKRIVFLPLLAVATVILGFALLTTVCGGQTRC